MFLPKILSLVSFLSTLALFSSCSDDIKILEVSEEEIEAEIVEDKKDTLPLVVIPEKLDDAEVLFNKDSIFTYEVTLDSLAWKNLQINAVDEEYTSVKFIKGNDTVNNVGMRFKGAYGSLKFCVNPDGSLKSHCPKLSLKFKFSEYKKDQRYMGLKRVNFHAMMNDKSKLKDNLGYNLYREMGIFSPRTSHANLIINGENMGVYAVVEQIDGRFTDSRWQQGDGNLYKEVWPKSSLASHYIKTLKTNEEVANVSGMLHFNSTVKKAFINSDKELFESLTPIENALNFLVVDLAIQNADGYRTFYCWGGNRYTNCHPHNFYWYQHEDKARFELIPWDLDGGFAAIPFITGMPEWNDLTVNCDKAIQNTPDRALGHPACDPYFRMLAVHYNEEYKQTIEEFLDGPFDVSKMNSDIDQWVKTLEPHIKNDPKVNFNTWIYAIEILKTNLSTFHQNMKDRMNGKAPTSYGLNLTKPADYEEWTSANAKSFIPTMTNPDSRFTTEINTDSPLEGKQDIKLSFDFQNSGSAAYSQWGSWRFIFQDNKTKDLTGLKTIKLKIRADKQSVVRIELGSSLYANPNSGKQYGWKKVIDIDPIELTLSVDEIGYAWSGQDPIANGEPTVEDLLKQVQALVIYPEQFGRVDGVYPDNRGYQGVFHIDDIRFEF
jgi:hypothetical protein